MFTAQVPSGALPAAPLADHAGGVFWPPGAETHSGTLAGAGAAAPSPRPGQLPRSVPTMRLAVPQSQHTRGEDTPCLARLSDHLPGERRPRRKSKRPVVGRTRCRQLGKGESSVFTCELLWGPFLNIRIWN